MRELLQRYESYGLDAPRPGDRLEPHLKKLFDKMDARIAELEAAPTLRDHFASAAMQGMLAADADFNDQMLAAFAYRIADAMLTARE